MASVIVVRETIAPYRHIMIGVASTWENAMRLTSNHIHGDAIEWAPQDTFGVVTGKTNFSGARQRKFQLMYVEVATKSHEFFPGS